MSLSLAGRGISTTSRVLNLSFKVAGVREQLNQIQDLITAAQVAIQTIIALQLLMTTIAITSPLGILLAIGTAVSIGTFAYSTYNKYANQPDEFAVYKSRSTYE